MVGILDIFLPHRKGLLYLNRFPAVSGCSQRRRVMRIMMHVFCPALFAVFVLAGPCSALEIEWAPVAADSNYLLGPPNANNEGGIDHSWANAPFRDPGQQNLASFRDQMQQPGRYAGGIGWDSLPVGTEVANSQGVDLNLVGLPFEAGILSTTNLSSIKVIEWEQPPPDPTSAGSTSGTKLISHLDRSGPSEWILDFRTPENYQLQGFGMVLANSGRIYGGATIAFYDPDGESIDFDFADGVRFPDHSTNDNFVGFWSDTPITRITISADQNTFMGRFDDMALVFVPEPGTIILLGLGGIALLRQRRRQKRI